MIKSNMLSRLSQWATSGTNIDYVKVVISQDLIGLLKRPPSGLRDCVVGDFSRLFFLFFILMLNLLNAVIRNRVPKLEFCEMGLALGLVKIGGNRQ